ncbi:hypothetical protein MKX01_017337 [Papaver californicum]|nr:hypothetical protein MKX01_017337 [Papaver californicum]
MASQLNCTPPKVGLSPTQDTFKRLRYLQEGRSNSISVRMSRKWEELDFLSTNDITSVDMVFVDESLHAVIPKHLIWKFDELVREGCLYSIQNLHLADAKPRFRATHNNWQVFFVGTLRSPHRINVYGYLKTIINLQFVLLSGGASCRQYQVKTIYRLGSTIQIALWGSAVNQVGNDPIDCDSISGRVLVGIRSPFHQQMLQDPPCHITVPMEKVKVPAHVIDSDNRKTIFQLTSAKWDPICSVSNILQVVDIIICNATPLDVLFETGWHYPSCLRCSKSIIGDDGDIWCTKCESKVLMPMPGMFKNSSLLSSKIVYHLKSLSHFAFSHYF